MLAGVGAFIGLFIVISLAIVAFAATKDDFVSEDVGNVFEKANAVASYADERLAAAANGQPMPGTPRILANQPDLQFVLVMGLVSQVFLVALAILVSRQGWRGFVRQVGLTDIHPGRLPLILGCVVLAYGGTFLYSLAAAATGISWLEPQSTLPAGVMRDSTTIVIAGVVTMVGAPISEEIFFRGLVFTGLSRWGFWVAAVGSGFMWSLVHFDPGFILPVLGIGILLSWLFRRRKSLFDAVAFHFVFNATSFMLLLATS